MQLHSGYFYSLRESSLVFTTSLLYSAAFLEAVSMSSYCIKANVIPEPR